MTQPQAALRSVASPVASGAVHVVLPGRHGSFSFVTDTPRPGRQMAGPPPAYLALAGWACCTVVTTTGVASRGRLPLEDIRVSFTVPDGVAGDACFEVEEAVTLHGPLNDAERKRLQRAAGYCPVSQMFTKASLQIEERVSFEPPTDVSVVRTVGLPSLLVPPGTAVGQHLLDTKEYEDGRMTDEGEVKVRLACDDGGVTRHWTVLGGHSSRGWVPSPVGLALAGLAASAATTLQRLAGQDGMSWSRVEVVLPQMAGGKDQVQADADANILRHRLITLHVFVEGGSSADEPAVLETLRADPLYTRFRTATV